MKPSLCLFLWNILVYTDSLPNPRRYFDSQTYILNNVTDKPVNYQTRHNYHNRNHYNVEQDENIKRRNIENQRYSDNLKIIESIAHMSLNNNDVNAKWRALENHEYKFSEVFKSILVTLLTYDDNELEHVFLVMENGLNKYKDDDINFREILKNKFVNNVYRKILKRFKETPVNVVREILTNVLNNMNHPKNGGKLEKIMNYLDTVYGNETKLLLSQLKDQFSQTDKHTKTSVDLANVIGTIAKNLFIAHYTNLDNKEKKDIQIVINNFFTNITSKFRHKFHKNPKVSTVTATTVDVTQKVFSHEDQLKEKAIDNIKKYMKEHSSLIIDVKENRTKEALKNIFREIFSNISLESGKAALNKSLRESPSPRLYEEVLKAFQKTNDYSLMSDESKQALEKAHDIISHNITISTEKPNILREIFLSGVHAINNIIKLTDKKDRKIERNGNNVTQTPVIANITKTKRKKTKASPAIIEFITKIYKLKTTITPAASRNSSLLNYEEVELKTRPILKHMLTPEFVSEIDHESALSDKTTKLDSDETSPPSVATGENNAVMEFVTDKEDESNSYQPRASEGPNEKKSNRSVEKNSRSEIVSDSDDSTE